MYLICSCPLAATWTSGMKTGCLGGASAFFASPFLASPFLGSVLSWAVKVGAATQAAAIRKPALRTNLLRQHRLRTITGLLTYSRALGSCNFMLNLKMEKYVLQTFPAGIA